MATRMQQRRGTAAQWISTNSGNGPILNAGEIGYETDTNKFKIGDGTNHWINLDYFVDANSTVNPAFGTSITFEGATADSYETTLQVTDPTADRTITFPDATGTVALTSDIAELSQDAIDSALTAGTGITKTYNDAANTLTIAVDTTAIQARVTDVSDTEIGYLNGVTSAIQTQIDTKLASATASTTYAPLASPTFTGTVTLPANTITQSMMSDDSVGTNEIVGLSVTTEKIAATAVTEAKIADGAVTSAKIANDTIVNADINSAAAIAQSKISGLTTDLAAKAPLASPTFTGAVTLGQAPTSDLHAATKLYVDNVTAGINFHESVHAASVNNLAANYSNGTSGVGATLTADTNRAFTQIDGESVVVGQRVLVKNQTDAKQNGIYTLTTNGSGSTPWVLTRATDADNNPSGELKNGDFCLVINGTVNAGYGYINNSTANPIVLGTDDVTYTAFSAGKTVVAGNGLTEATPGTLSIDTSITQARVANVSDTEIGYLDGVTSGIQGQIDLKAPLANPTFTGTVTLPTGTVTSGMILDGTIVNADINASAAIDWTKLGISSTVSATEIGYVDGVTSAIQTQLDGKSPTAGSSSITTLGTVTTGTWSATTIALNKGGTGSTTQAGAANAILPTQTSNSGKYLTTNGTDVSWATVSSYSAPTLGSTSIASGATVTTIAGLTLSNATLTGTLTAGSATGTSGQVLSSTGSGVQWITPAAGADEMLVLMGAY
jgi:hypothetical protein